jgi:hypothetical protein
MLLVVDLKVISFGVRFRVEWSESRVLEKVSFGLAVVTLDGPRRALP